MKLFIFFNSKQNQIASDAECVNDLIRNSIQIINMVPHPWSSEIKIQMTQILTDIELLVIKINTSITQLSDKKLKRTRVLSLDGKPITISQWIYFLNLFINEINQHLES